jgi:uncharacterized protein YndB with AHSA1/START domain
MSSSQSSRDIRARPDAVYAAFVDPVALVEWLPPGTMTGRMHRFDARVGGGYEMSLYYTEPGAEPRGKTDAHEDRVDVRFVELDPPRRIVEAVRFLSAEAAFHGEMTLTVSIEPLPGGARVTLTFDNLPAGVRPEDNDAGAAMSLAQLARRLEAQR